jgi:hypothetical protein
MLTPKQRRFYEVIRNRILSNFTEEARASLTGGEILHVERLAVLSVLKPDLTNPLIDHFCEQIELRVKIPLELFYDLIILNQNSPEEVKVIAKQVRNELRVRKSVKTI